MVRVLVSWSCALSLAVIEGSEQLATDHTGLLQRKQGVQAGTHSRMFASNSELADLFQSSEKLLRSGATPIVVNLTRETLAEIKDSVIPAIDAAHETDKQLLADGFATFDRAQAAYDAQLVELSGLRATDRNHSQDHSTCRVQERGACELAAECERRRQELWKVYQEKKDAWTCTTASIHHSQCVQLDKFTWDYQSEPGGSTHMVHSSWEARTEAVEYFRSYKVTGAEYFAAKEEYDTHYELCVQRNATHEAATAECDGEQTQLEKAACARSSRRLQVIEDLASVWAARTESYTELVASVESLEEDRKKEFTTLATVECLLDRIYERGGEACDEATGEADQVISTCRDLQTDTTHLDLEYPEAPEKPADPDAFPQPCDETFEAEEYGKFTGFCFENRQPCEPCA